MRVRSLWYIALLLLVLLMSLYVFRERFFLPEENQSPSALTPSRLRLTFVGDLMAHRAQLERAIQADGSYDFRPCFRWVKPYLSRADLCFGNLETTFSGTSEGRTYSGHPAFNTPDSYGAALRDAGFDLLFVANNHALDYGSAGLRRTLRVLREQELFFAGVKDPESPELSFPLLHLKGFTLAVLAYTQHSNNPFEQGDELSIQPLDTNQVGKDLLQARKEGADLVIVHFHFGTEYQREPDPFQRAVVAFARRYGADLIIGEHPHVLQPVEVFAREHPGLDRGVVAWSLGNLLAHQFGRYTNGGLMLSVEIVKDPITGLLSLEQVLGVPTYVTLPRGFPHTIFPAQAAMPDLPDSLARQVPPQLVRLTPTQIQRMRQTFEDARSLLLEKDTAMQFEGWFGN